MVSAIGPLSADRHYPLVAVAFDPAWILFGCKIGTVMMLAAAGWPIRLE